MPNCDLCNAETSWFQGTQVSAVEFRELVASGLESAATVLAVAKTPKTNSPSPAQRSVHAGAQKVISYQF
jgi:hypothetical protein